jgi:hypothetical protein
MTCARVTLCPAENKTTTRLKPQVKHAKHRRHLPFGQQPLQVDGGEVVVTAKLVESDDAAESEGGATGCSVVMQSPVVGFAVDEEDCSGKNETDKASCK